MIRLEPDNCECRSVAAIPCHNEGLFVGDVVRQGRQYVGEVILVDDDSTDCSGREGQGLSRRAVHLVPENGDALL